MGMLDKFRGNQTRPPQPAATAATPDLGMSANDETLRRQRLMLFGGLSGLALLGGWWLMTPNGSAPPALSDPGKGVTDVKISTEDLGSRNLSEKEWIAMSENRLRAQDSQLQHLQGQGDQLSQMQAQIDALKSQNQAMESDGKAVLSAYESENKRLQAQVASSQGAGAPGKPGPRSLYGVNGPAAYQSLGDLPGPDGQVRRPGELKVINFASASGAVVPASAQVPSGLGPAAKGGALVSDSPNYLPANSFATARVIVGVDAASNVQSQSDPLPVVLRITGPARSVANHGKVLKTRLEGCLVNGAARGDLSSEKVYVKLARMTCMQPGGRYAESEVKGFIAFGGKTGVRGRVVSREGGLAMQAFMAGVVGGIGRGFSANTQSVLAGTTTVINGQKPKLSAGEIGTAGLGEGVSTAGDRLSQYLIERAEQYQPVIEMPTGVDVEIVFLEGVSIRN